MIDGDGSEGDVCGFDGISEISRNYMYQIHIPD